MKMKRFLFNLITLMGLATSGVTVAQELNDSQRPFDKNVVSTQALVSEQCFSSGSGVTFLKVCITDNGNLSWFESPSGKFHLQQREGYAVCSGGMPGNGDTVHGFDAYIAAEGWGNPTISQPGGSGTFPLIITRQSLDGVIQLKQTFTRNTPERGIDLKLDVKNISGVAVNHVFLSRYFDADADGTPDNNFDWTHDSVWGRDSVNPSVVGRGLSLMVAPSAGVEYWYLSAAPYAYWDPYGQYQQYARGCDNWGGSGPAYHDLVGFAQVKMATTLNPGQSKTVTLRYRPI